MSATLTVGPDLGTRERCDRCGAGAKVRVMFPSGVDLLFCGHHARRFETKLFEQAAAVQWNP
jgi:hypothetical protein